MKTLSVVFVLLSLTAAAWAQINYNNIVQDSGFERYCSSTTATATTANWYTDIAAVHASVYGVTAVDGACVQDFIDAFGSPTPSVSQTLVTTPNAFYDITINARSVDPLSTANVGFSFDAVSLAVDVGFGGWTVIQAIAFTPSAATDIVIVLNSGDALIDAISVVCVQGCPSVFGDPHFIGLDGKRFDFDGEPGQIFNLLSDSEVQVNTLLGQFKLGPHSFIEGVVMTQIGMRLREHSVVVNAGGPEFDSVGFVLVDGQLLEDDASLDFSDEGEGKEPIHIEFDRKNSFSDKLGIGSHDNAVGHLTVVYGSQYVLTVVLVESGRNHEGQWVVPYARRSLDFSAHPLSSDLNPHGLFGQTSEAHSNKRSRSNIEGDKEDYKIQSGDLLGTDFTFNKFGL